MFIVGDKETICARRITIVCSKVQSPGFFVVQSRPIVQSPRDSQRNRQTYKLPQAGERHLKHRYTQATHTRSTTVILNHQPSQNTPTMYLATLLPTVFALLAITTDASPTTLSRRGLAGAYYTCTGTNFSGMCSWTAPNTQCHIQGSPGVVSIGPDQGTICHLYKGSDCSGDSLSDVKFPGRTAGANFGSFRCYKSWPGTRREEMGEAGEGKEFGALKEVESDGREEGMIGLKKGTYY
jgi:hypothetical protein